MKETLPCLFEKPVEKTSGIHTETLCYHCGNTCEGTHLRIAEKSFCCDGCKLVYEILNENGLCDYYDIEKQPGVTQNKKIREGQFRYLDDEQISSRLLSYRDEKIFHVSLYLPQMHCSSCVWLLENLHRVDPGVLSAEVNFPRKEISISARTADTNLRKIAETLTRIGYEPHISLEDADRKKPGILNRQRILKLGIAGFCFGNIMMLSFPEYLGFAGHDDIKLHRLFSWLNLALSLPVFFYSSSEFFVSAWKGLMQRFLNIDAPVALAILITFIRSAWEITSGTGAGYLDSMSGIVFFMLVGRVFQDHTYDTISFERNYKSYFPISVTIKEEGEEKTIPVSKLKPGHRILVRNGELVPADSILFFGQGALDYSFVTGESAPVAKGIGEIVYAGGRQTGAMLELEVVKEVSQSYLTSLWNKEVFKEKKEEKEHSFIHALARHFTWFLLALAGGALLFWWLKGDLHRGIDALTSVLIVACPCALLLSATFTNGNMIRILGRKRFYARHSSVIETLGRITHIVFDKTGTITQAGKAEVKWEGNTLSFEDKNELLSLFRQSSHPLSRAIAEHLRNHESYKVKHFKEHTGKGIEANVKGNIWKLGSWNFVSGQQSDDGAPKDGNSRVFISKNDSKEGVFLVRNRYREGFAELVKSLRPYYRLSLISGDRDTERADLENIFGQGAELRFEQHPEDKLAYIKHLQDKGEKVLMVGDGLNDAGALRQSHAGIAVSDNINNFSPACDVIMEGSVFERLYHFLSFSREGKWIILGSFGISLLYNTVGLWYAVTGTLSPVVAAILMPLSSISIVAFTTGISAMMARKLRN
jgi:Cu+-exporting ATPase